MSKKVVMEKCLHPMEGAFKEEREDGSGKWDLICGICGATMCEVPDPRVKAPPGYRPLCEGEALEDGDFFRNESGDWEAMALGDGCIGELYSASIHHPMARLINSKEKAAVDQVAPCVNTDCPDNCKSGCGKVLLDCDDYISVSPYVCMTTDCSHFGQDLDRSNCLRNGGKDMLECVDFTSSKEAVEAPCDACPEAAEGCGAAVEDREDCAAEIAASDASTLIEEGAAGSPIITFDLASGPGTTVVAYVTREPDKIGGRFQELLPVPVDDHELAQFGIELAEQTSLWRRTKLDAKKFAKAAKEVTDKCEERMVEIEEIFQEHAQMVSVDVQWEYDFTSGVKKLRRCDTWEITKEGILSVEERQPSFDFGASADSVKKLADLQATEGLTDQNGDQAGSPEERVHLCDSCIKVVPTCDGEPIFGCDVGGDKKDDNVVKCDQHVQAEEKVVDASSPDLCSKCEGAGYYMEDDPDKEGGEVLCDCEAGKLLKMQSQSMGQEHPIEERVFPEVPEGFEVIDLDANPPDKERRCCMPSDRDEVIKGDVIISYCRVCHLILKKTPVGGDPWDTIDFAYGDKIDFEDLPGAQA